jgi:hypothetical protein
LRKSWSVHLADGSQLQTLSEELASQAPGQCKADGYIISLFKAIKQQKASIK